MKGIKIRCDDRTFIVPEEHFTAIPIYQRYGSYCVDLEGCELEAHENILFKKRFNLVLAANDVIHVEMDIIDQNIVSKLINNQVEDVHSFPLSEEDILQMIAKFQTFEKLLKKNGII